MKELKKIFRKNYEVERLPYNRGFVFALYLEHLLKENNSSLDQVMLDLFKSSKEFSSKHFNEIIKKYIPERITQEMNDYIDKGETYLPS